MSRSSGASWFSRAIDLSSIALLCAAIWVYAASRRPVAATPSPGALFRDSTMAALPVVNSRGEARDLVEGAGGKGVLIAVFRSDCPVCQRQKAAWGSLAFQATRRGILAVGLTAEPLGPNLSGYFPDSVPLELASLRDPTRFAAILQTEVVPTTILVQAGGRVVFHHAGLLQDADVSVLLSKINN